MNHYFLENDLMFLKKLELSDIGDEYIQWLNDPEINNFMETRFSPHSYDDVVSYVKSVSIDNSSVLFGIYDKTKSFHIGNIKIGPINWIHRKASISLFIGNKDYWGKGYAAQVIGLIENYAFSVLNLRKLDAGIYSENIASKKAFEKNGFLVEGILKEDCFINNKWTDVFLMGKINDN